MKFKASTVSTLLAYPLILKKIIIENSQPEGSAGIMKYKIITASLTLLFVLTVVPAYGEGEGDIYYCADSDANGFQMDEKKGSYQRSGFSGDKFKMKLDLPNKKIELAMECSSNMSYICTQPYSEIHLSCSSDYRMFNFHTDTGRYVFAAGYGYVVGKSDSVFVSIGTCDKF
jgi:hypothetical protein